MKKYLRKILEFIKKNKLIFIIAAIVLLIVGVIYFIFFRTKIDTVKSVKKILSPNSYSVECLDSECDYIVALKGDKYGKYTIYVYNSKGKKIAKINDTYDANASYVKTVSGATKNYVIFSKMDYTSGKIVGYSLTSTKGKPKYNSDNALTVLTDYLIAEKTGDTFNIIDSNGTVKYKKATNIKTYANNTYLSFSTKSENIIVDSKGNSKLSGYSIVKEVKNDKGKVLYFVVEDGNKNGYYYYNFKSNKVVGESFNGYVEGDNSGELIITKKENGIAKKYVLTKDGKQEEYTVESTGDYISEIKTKINTSEYSIYPSSVKTKNQKMIFVNKSKENSFGVYNVSSKKYTKLISYNTEYGGVTIHELDSEKGLYLEVNCSINYCKKNTTVVYDMVKGKELYRSESKDNIPQNYTHYEGDYKVIKYSLNSSDDYKEKYVLYDKNNKEILKSDKEIVVVDKKIIFGKEVSSSSLVLYSSKRNKVINTEENLASRISIGNTYVYKYTKDNVYLLNEKGKLLGTLPSSASFIYSESAIIYIDNNEIDIINPVDNKNKTYKLGKNEKINDNSGKSIAPYKNSIYVNNTVDKVVKVINVNGRTVKNIKNSTLNSVNYNEETDTVIIITKKISGNNSYYGLYIAK